MFWRQCGRPDQSGTTLASNWASQPVHWTPSKQSVRIQMTLTAIIKDWLKNGKPKPSWAELAKALKSRMVGYAQLAEEFPA